jgi:hypothetical protein
VGSARRGVNYGWKVLVLVIESNPRRKWCIEGFFLQNSFALTNGCIRMYARLRGFGKMQDEAEHVFDKLLEHP